MPEAWPSIRSTARWVLPVLVGPSTATSRESSAPIDGSLMALNEEDTRERRKRRQGLSRVIASE